MTFSEKIQKLLDLEKKTLKITTAADAEYVKSFIIDDTDAVMYEVEDSKLVFDLFGVSDKSYDNTSDAQLIRSGVWPRTSCRMLFLVTNNVSVPLAKSTPDGVTDLSLGWITEKGEVIIRSER